MNRLALAFVLLLALVRPAFAQTASDPFTGTGALSGSWTRQNDTSGATAARVSDQIVLAASQDVFYFWNANSFSNNHWSQVTTISSSSTHFLGATVRASGTTAATFNAYACVGSSDFGGILKFINGAATTLYTVGAFSSSSGDVFRCDVVGDTITFRKNGAVVGTVAGGGALSTGRPGLEGYASGSTVIADTWSAGEASACLIGGGILCP